MHKLLSFKTNNTRQVTIEDKQHVIETYSQNKITMQLPYCKYAKKHYLRCTMSLAYDDYVTGAAVTWILCSVQVHCILMHKEYNSYMQKGTF